MKLTRLLIVALLASVAWAQEAPKPAEVKKPAEAAKPAVSPEMKAFNDAMAVKDPAKRIEALQKFIKDNPKHDNVGIARRQIITAAVKAYPKEPKKIESITAAQVKLTPPAQVSRVYGAAASALLDDGIQLDLARKYAGKSRKSLKYETYVADLKSTASKDRPLPSDAQLRSRFNGRVADAWATLAQVEFKTNNHRASEKAYKKAIALDSGQKGSATLALASIYEKQNKVPQAFAYATTARLARPNTESRETFERLYRKTHNGSLNGVEEYLDSEYRKQFPPPIHVEPYTKSDKRTDRIVLAEVHTGAGCPPCVAADLAFDAVMERYTRNDVVVLMYHQHIPRPDPLTNDDTRDRWKFVSGRGVPTYIIDGKLDSGGGGRQETAEVEGKIRKLLEPRLEMPTGAGLAVRAARQGKQVKVEASVTGLSKAENLVLRVALTEKLVRYSGQNGIRFHPMVVRALASFPVKKEGKTEHVFNLDQVAAKLKEHIANFEKKDERHNPDGKFRFTDYPIDVKADNLAVVVYLEDAKSKAVLQAAQAEVGQ